MSQSWQHVSLRLWRLIFLVAMSSSIRMNVVYSFVTSTRQIAGHIIIPRSRSYPTISSSIPASVSGADGSGGTAPGSPNETKGKSNDKIEDRYSNLSPGKTNPTSSPSTSSPAGPVPPPNAAKVPPPFRSSGATIPLEPDPVSEEETKAVATDKVSTVESSAKPPPPSSAPLNTRSPSPSFPLNALFTAAARAATPKSADSGEGGHDAFRFEWGRWVDDGHMEELMNQVNLIKIMQGGRVYDRLLSLEDTRTVMPTVIEKAKGGDNGIQDAVFLRDKAPRRFRVSGGDHWDCILHVLPKGQEWKGRWPTGSWAVVRCLTGMTEIAMLRGPDRDGIVSKVTTMRLRGGGDGTISGGKEGGGEDCVKYVGGAQRSYSGVSGKTMLLEVVLRPPVGSPGLDGDGLSSSDIEPLPPEDVLMDGIADVEEQPVEDDEEDIPFVPKSPPRERPEMDRREGPKGSGQRDPRDGPQRSRAGRSDRPPLSDRLERPPFTERLDRPPFSERLDRPPFSERMDRPPLSERRDRVPLSERLERPPRGQRFDGPPLDRPPLAERLERARVDRYENFLSGRSDGPREMYPEPPLPFMEPYRRPLADFDAEFEEDFEEEDFLEDDFVSDELPDDRDEYSDDSVELADERLESERATVKPEPVDAIPKVPKSSLGSKMGLKFDNVGGLDDQLESIVRRVLASRANPEAARRLGVNHVRGILLSGPPGCGKTLLARELSEMLGAREPKIVNGPEILDKFIGAAEKNIRDLFEPAEREFEQLGDSSALHVIVFDELDSIARRRGSVSGDTTGVRDSVVNQLLAKMDGVKEANNILVIGMTNRPELLDPALTRPGRLEVQLRVELPDALGRRDILRIHTRRMKEQGAISWEALQALEDVESEKGIPARTEYFTGAELAGLVRSAASFALARSVQEKAASGENEDEATVRVRDLEQALTEIRPALGKQDEVLEARFPYGISPCSPAMQRIMRDLERFTSTPDLLAKQHLTPGDSTRNGAKSLKSKKSPSTLQSLLLVGDGYKGGTGATALACWAASQASEHGEIDYVRLITSLDLLTSGGGDEAARARSLVERFTEAASMSNSLLVFDDIDQVCAGSGADGYSNLMLSTLRALLRSPTAGVSSLSADTQDPGNDIVEKRNDQQTRSLSVLAATSRTDAVCSVLHELFDETLVVPVLSDVESVKKLLSDGISQMGVASADISANTVNAMAETMVNRLKTVGCKTALRLLERAVAMTYRSNEDQSTPNKDPKDPNSYFSRAWAGIIDDYVRDETAAGKIVCKVK